MRLFYSVKHLIQDQSVYKYVKIFKLEEKSGNT